MALLGPIVAAALSFAFGGLALLVGRRLGVVDRPDQDLKPHQGLPVPLGGVGILIGLHAGLAISGGFDLALLVATVLIWGVGLFDDLGGMSPIIRLAAAAGVGVLFVALADRPDRIVLAAAWVAVAVIAVNAVNLFDGLDGLAGSVTAIVALGLGLFGVLQGVDTPWAVAVLTGALIGFLFWNRSPARLFLGDNGAYVVGFVLAWGVLRASPDRAAGVVAIALLGVPVMDLAVTLIRRVASRAPLFGGDRDHSYDRLHQLGWSAGRVTVVFAAAQVVWSVLVLGVAALTGDIPAGITAIVVGAAAVGLVSLSLIRHRRVPE